MRFLLDLVIILSDVHIICFAAAPKMKQKKTQQNLEHLENDSHSIFLSTVFCVFTFSVSNEHFLKVLPLN